MTKFVIVFFCFILFVTVSASANAMQQTAEKKGAPRIETKQQKFETPIKSVVTPAPSITISSPPNQGESTALTSAHFTFTSSKLSTICWRLDGGMRTCSAPQMMSFKAMLDALLLGSHALEVTAADTAGNLATSVRQWTITIK
jgi:hypothetical protein